MCRKKFLYKLSQEKTFKSSLPHLFVNGLNMMSVGMAISSTFPSIQNSFFVPGTANHTKQGHLLSVPWQDIM